MKQSPVYRNYLISVSDILEAKLKAHERPSLNSNDKGDLCESFIKEFLIDTLGDLFKIYRGGNIVNSKNEISNQLDIILCRKRSLKLFGDKGIYPLESVMGEIEITANLTKEKLIKDCEKLLSIPKRNYRFNMSMHLPEAYREESHKLYRTILPFTCIFGYRGDIDQSWVKILTELFHKADQVAKSLLPTIVAVNKQGLIYKSISKSNDGLLFVEYLYMDLSHPDLHGETFGRIVNSLYNISQEEVNMQFDYTDYFNGDIQEYIEDNNAH